MAVLETKAKEILIAVYGGDGDISTMGTAIDYVIADSLSVTQADAEENTFYFETTDTPETYYKPGAYNIELNNAELSEYFMTEIMGWTKITDPVGIVAPTNFSTRFISLQIKMAEDKYYFLPKVSIAPKLVMESVKTNLVHGNLSGIATNALVGEKRTAFGKYSEPILIRNERPPLPSLRHYMLWEDGTQILWENNDNMIVEQIYS